MTAALRVGAAALLTQLILQLAWHGLLAPTSRAAVALATLPLVPGLWICLRKLRRGVLIGAIVSLFYFCHGVADLWADRDARSPAAAETALSLLVIGCLGWDARASRRAK
jgi:uncharacterized membrane protein